MYAGEQTAVACPSLAERLDRLDRLLAMTDRIEPVLIDAIAADFGHRSHHEILLVDVMMVRAAIRHTRRHLARWMRVCRVATARLTPESR